MVPHVAQHVYHRGAAVMGSLVQGDTIAPLAGNIRLSSAFRLVPLPDSDEYLLDVDGDAGSPVLDLDAIPGTLSAGKLYGEATLDNLTTEGLSVHSSVDLGFVGGGDPPLIVSATSGLVANLNADKVDGEHGSYYLDRAHHTNTQAFSTVTEFSASNAVNLVFASPGSGGAGPMAIRALVAGDIPVLDAAKITSGIFARAQLPTQVAYEDEANTYTHDQRFNTLLSQGIAPSASVAFLLSLDGALTGTSQSGINADTRFSSAATSLGRAVAVRLRTSAASFTMATGTAIAVMDAVKGTGSTITTLIGLDISNQTQGATNYSIRTGAAQCQFGGLVNIAGALDHDGSTAGFFGVTPAARPAALTQTYATATRTHAARTAVALTDSIAGTVSTTLAAIPDPADTPVTADALRDDLVANVLPKIRNALSSIVDAISKRKADCENTAQFANVLADDLQTLGLEQ